MSVTEVIDPVDVICGLKAVTKALECYHKMDLLKQKHSPESAKFQSLPASISIRKAENVKRPVSAKKEHVTNFEKSVCGDSERISKEIKPDKPEIATGTKIPELRGGVLFSMCNCVHRDGLQDHCPLSQCQGQPECMIKPWPDCPPARLFKLRHPELCPGTSLNSVTC